MWITSVDKWDILHIFLTMTKICIILFIISVIIIINDITRLKRKYVKNG